MIMYVVLMLNACIIVGTLIKIINQNVTSLACFITHGRALLVCIQTLFLAVHVESITAVIYMSPAISAECH